MTTKDSNRATQQTALVIILLSCWVAMGWNGILFFMALVVLQMFFSRPADS
jgi:ABC-type polysaccharide transport system permease subunit